MNKLKKEDFFYLLILLTMLVTRISIIIVPEVDIKISNIIIHHFWFGVILIVLGFFISKKRVYSKIWIYAWGAGLIIDQLIFMILGAGQDKEYWALSSLLGTIIIAGIIFPIRTKITNFLINR